MAERKDTNLARAYSLRNPSEATTLYDEWATDYDADMQSHAYASPKRAATVLLQHLPSRTTPPLAVLDAGCGTGLVGVALHESRVLAIDGLDLSPGMLDAARAKGVYRDLGVADLTKPIEKGEGVYDAVVCVGTLTKGHVGPAVLAEFVRVVRKEGVVVATIHEEIWKEGGFAEEVKRLKGEGKVEVVSEDGFGMMEGSESGGLMLVLRKV